MVAVACSMQTRRAVLAMLGAVPFVPSSRARADGGVIRIGQSIARSGTLAELGEAMHQGAVAAFNMINGAGGIHGRRIDLVVQDDGYDVKRALSNIDAFIADRSIFALFNCMGTPMIEAMLPRVVESGIPFFAPFSGALLARPKARNVFNIRASYPDEAEQLVQHLVTIGITRIGIAYTNNAFGKEVHDGARAAMERHKATSAGVVTVDNSGADARAAVDRLLAAQPDAVLMGLAGKAAIEFIKSSRVQRRGLPLYALSILGAAATIKALGPDGVGIAMSQVVPLPSQGVMPVVRSFVQAWQASEIKLEPSHLALEGFINARVFAEALRRAGREPTRDSFIDATWNLRRYDLGGFEINFSEPGRSASRFVELTMVSRTGRFIR
jgi:branched-chain amino acid transport system substrate-binding protein